MIACNGGKIEGSEVGARKSQSCQILSLEKVRKIATDTRAHHE